jgi:hypothetical protein
VTIFFVSLTEGTHRLASTSPCLSAGSAGRPKKRLWRTGARSPVEVACKAERRGGGGSAGVAPWQLLLNEPWDAWCVRRWKLAAGLHVVSRTIRSLAHFSKKKTRPSVRGRIGRVGRCMCVDARAASRFCSRRVWLTNDDEGSLQFTGCPDGNSTMLCVGSNF